MQIQNAINHLIWGKCISSISNLCWEAYYLKQWGLNKMADILQTTYWTAFSRQKIIVFDWNFTFVCPAGRNWQANNVSGNGLVSPRQQVIIWTTTDPIHWCIYIYIYVIQPEYVNAMWPSNTIWWHIWVNTSSGDGWLPEDTQAITWTNVDSSLVSSIDIHLRSVSQEIHSHGSLQLAWKLLIWNFIQISQGPMS